MSTFLYGFLTGVVVHFALEWAVMIPFMRKHRVKLALLQRAKMYQQRCAALREAGKEEEALVAIQECKALLAQVEELNKK